MNPSAEAAQHLAEIDQRYGDHLEALRRRAEDARGQIAGAASVLLEKSSPQRDLHEAPDWSHDETGWSASVEEPPPYTPPPPNPFAEHALIPDTPLVATDETPALADIEPETLTDEDGIPLWQD